MFKAPFSFKGRITRTEFALSHLIFLGSLIVIIASAIFLDSTVRSVVCFSILVIAVWFRIAQGAKRCHDTGVSGWCQFIPFYGLVMLFQKSSININKFGSSPKIGIIDEVCEIVSIKNGIVIVRRNNNKILKLVNVTLPNYAKEGDLIQHSKNGCYVVIDKDGNLVFRM